MLYLSWLDVSDAAGLHHLPALQQIFSWLIYLLSSGKVMLKYLTGAGGHVPPPPTFESGGGKDMFVPPPHFQTQNLGLGIEPTDICHVTLAWLASR